MEDLDWEFLTTSQSPQDQQQEDFNDYYNNNSGVIQSDYFSIDKHTPHSSLEGEHVEEYSSDDPNNTIISSRSSSSDSSGPTSVNVEFNDAINTQEQHEHIDDTVARNDMDESEIEANEMKKEKEEGVVVWWRVPMEVLRYCVLRVNVSTPVWSLSIAAAAFMGFLILRRRYYLYNMKRKAQGVHLKLTLDHKVSPFTSRAARLNEAFSVVKWVPMIQPSLSAPGLTPWLVMSMR